MIIKIIILLTMAIILISLGSALFYLFRRDKPRENMAKFLAIRVGISITLFLFLMLGFYMEWLTPHGL